MADSPTHTKSFARRPLIIHILTLPKVVNLQYASGATVSFTMVAYTTLICERQTRLHFTHGEIVGDMNQFTVTDFRSRQTTVHRPSSEGGSHGGGDVGLIRTFVEAVRTRQQDLLGTDVTDVLKSHLTVFAAEHSRKTGTVVDCVEFENATRSAWDRSVQTSTASGVGDVAVPYTHDLGNHNSFT